MQIVILDSVPLNPGDLDWAPLAALGDLVIHERSAPEEVAARIADATIVFTNKAKVSAAAIAGARHLRLISVLATGYDIVDVAAAKAAGVTVSNVPGYGPASVAQATWALILELCHHAGAHDVAIRAGRWQASRSFCFWESPLVELSGKTLTIVGLGAIGRRVARIAEAFGMTVIGAALPGRTRPASQAASPWPRLPLREALAKADVLSFHCPLTPETRQLLNAERLTWLKPSALVVNSGRGAVVDEAALAAALHAGHLAGYAADVLSVEPPPADHPLLHTPRTILTPHFAWATFEARQRLLAMSVDNLRLFLAGTPQHVVS
jgi:glycerate dehydrogenase